MNERYYYDVMNECIFHESRNFDFASGQFFEAIRGESEGIYMDHFVLPKGKRIIMAWTEIEESRYGWDQLVTMHFRKCGVADLLVYAQLDCRFYPPSVFDEMLAKGDEVCRKMLQSLNHVKGRWGGGQND